MVGTSGEIATRGTLTRVVVRAHVPGLVTAFSLYREGCFSQPLVAFSLGGAKQKAEWVVRRKKEGIAIRETPLVWKTEPPTVVEVTTEFELRRSEDA